MLVEQLEKIGVDPLVINIMKSRGITKLMPIQIKAINAGVLRGKNLVLAAPTSAGKTLVGELAATMNAGYGLTAFLVSHKALAREIFQIFDEHYIVNGERFLKVGICTSDEDSIKDEWTRIDVAVATYEKFYATVVSSPWLARHLRAVVADEIQLIGDPIRGPTVEFLLTKLKQLTDSHGKSPQIVALSASLRNGDIIAKWLNAEYQEISKRIPPLGQEIWMPNSRIIFAEPGGEPERRNHHVNVGSVGEVVNQLMSEHLGPVGVMATTKPDAIKYAEDIQARLPIDEDFPISIIEEFRAMSEDEETTTAIAGMLPHGVGIHHADLCPEQRRVIEAAFRDGKLSVLVATPTLVAGVNLPFRTILYPKLTRWNGKQEAYIDITEYINGAGRAGRCGCHNAGTAILLAQSIIEEKQLHRFVTHRSEDVSSKLAERTTEYQMIHLLVGNRGQTLEEIVLAASKTFWGFERGIWESAEELEELSKSYSDLIDNEKWKFCWICSKGKICLTPSGRAIASSGQEPVAVLETYNEIMTFSSAISQGENPILQRDSLVARMCMIDSLDEFLPGFAQFRFRLAQAAYPFVHKLFLNSQPGYMQILAAAHALVAVHAESLPKEIIKQLQPHRAERTRLTEQIARLLHAAASMADAENASGNERLVYEIHQIAESLDFQVPLHALCIARVFELYPVPNVGPIKKIRLAELAQGELSRLLRISDEQMEGAVGKKQVKPVREKILMYLNGFVKEQSERQLSEAKKDAKLYVLIEPLLRESGTAFEPAVHAALSALDLDVDRIEQKGGRQQPDLRLVTPDGRQVEIECKTTMKFDAEISRSEIRDSRKKFSQDPDTLTIVIGRPTFSAGVVEDILRPENRSPQLRLVTAGALVELILMHYLRGVPSVEALRIMKNFLHIGVARVRAELTTDSLIHRREVENRFD